MLQMGMVVMADNVTMDDMVIDEPLVQYTRIYKDAHHQNASDFIDSLIEKSMINVEENREKVKEIRKKEKERDTLAKQIGKFNSLKGFLIFLIITALLGIIYGIYDANKYSPKTLTYILIPIGIVLMIICLIVIFRTLNPKIKLLKKDKDVLILKIRELISAAWNQLKPLNDLFYDGMAAELFQKTIPLIMLDKMFDSRRLDYLVNKFGLDDAPDLNRSTLYVQSGEIKGNPFYIAEDLVHQMGEKTYSGSITIHWTTTSRVNNRTVTNHHSQVLTASINRPFPLYTEQSYLVYGNDAAPALKFSRLDSNAENLTEKQIDKFVNKEIKKLEKKSEKSITQGSNYTVLGNSEFEVLWGATNRNNEVQFRMLFTPLAQKQLLQLMKEKTIGFGDDFDFIKHNKINIIVPEHLSQIKLNISPVYFQDYDVDTIRSRFLDYQNAYFRHLYFTFSTVLAIPLYQQTKTQEYIYKDLYDSNVSFFEHEETVNRMNETLFKHPLSVTRNILKTQIVKKDKDTDVIKVVAYGYRTEPRIEYETRMGGDGRLHTIPIKWDEYIQVENEASVGVQVLPEQKELTPQEKFKAIFTDLKTKDITPENAVILTKFIAYMIKK